jgi:DNA-binding MarR family transcriptional regulator
MAYDLTHLEMAVWQALLHAHYDITRVLDAELRAEHGLTWSGYDVLVRLARAPGRRLPMAELARRVMMSPSGLTRAVDSLVEDRLAARERDADDGRVVFAELTSKGLERIRQASRTHLRGIREHFTGRLSSAQQRSVAAALQVITGPHRPH